MNNGKTISANYLFSHFPRLELVFLLLKSKQLDRVFGTAIETVPCRTRICKIRLQGIVSFALDCVGRYVPLVHCLEIGKVKADAAQRGKRERRCGAKQEGIWKRLARGRERERRRETDTEQLLSRRMRVDLRADSHRRIGHDLESPAL